jgi:hypothetical protein
MNQYIHASTDRLICLRDSTRESLVTGFERWDLVGLPGR